MIAEEQFRKDKMSFQMCEAMVVFKSKETRRFHIFVFATFSFMNNDVTLPEKI